MVVNVWSTWYCAHARVRAHRSEAYCLCRLNNLSDQDVSGVIGKGMGSRSFVVIRLNCF